MDFIDLLSNVKQRERRYAPGTIALASDYVSTIKDCVGKDAEKFFGLGTSAQWNNALKDAAKKLVYRSDDMTAGQFKRAAKLGAKAAKRGALIKRNLPKPPTKKPKKDEDEGDESGALYKGACMEFDCIMTSAKRDRDRDILEPAGARLDPSMPLLWQHIPLQPIGKMLRVLEQTDEIVRVRCAIVDNELGRDAARFVEFGALRISHGFVPTAWEPIEEEDGDEGMYAGWHITEYDVLEISLVSIPSNTDAGIEAFSRGKLFHPLMKAWAGDLYSRRKRFVSTNPEGDQMATNPAISPVHVHVHMDGKAKGKKDEDEDADKDEGDEEGQEEAKEETSEHASMGRVHLMLEQLGKMEDLPEAAASLVAQALGELEQCMKEDSGEGEETDETEQPEEEEADEEADEERDEDAEEEADEDAEEEADDEPEEEADAEQVTDDSGFGDEDEEDGDEDEEGKAEGDVEPSDDEGRADEDDEKDFDLADELFNAALAKHAKKPQKGTDKPAKAKGTEKKPSKDSGAAKGQKSAKGKAAKK